MGFFLANPDIFELLPPAIQDGENKLPWYFWLACVLIFGGKCEIETNFWVTTDYGPSIISRGNSLYIARLL